MSEGTAISRTARLMSGMRLAGWALTAITLTSACLDSAPELPEIGHHATGTETFGFAKTREVDILFVIDNSVSMGEEQALLAQNFGAFIEVLENEEIRASYRVAITTTDNGNPACTGTPDAGQLIMSSCKQRLADFDDGELDVRDIACNDICSLDGAALELLPTTTDIDSDPVPRPWLENIAGETNLPGSTSMVEAFECLAPQGIVGCGFESPLESMYLALMRMQDAQDPSYGFLREQAVLVVVFVTDEADCSATEEFGEIFDPSGDKLFWSDPTSSAPSSAVCWNAGVSCSGDPSNYDTCDAVNKDTSGALGVEDGQAVLRPMSRYLGLLDGLEQQKRTRNPDAQVVVSLIGGVTSAGTPFYADSDDLAFQDRFGIGPGCQSTTPNAPDDPVQAVPPVRLRELVDAFTPGNSFSICDADYSPALQAIAQSGGPQIQPACFGYCVEDTDPSTTMVEPECVVEEHTLGDGGSSLPECLRDQEGYVIEDNDYVVPAGQADACYALLTDDDSATATTTDDMSDFCMDQSANLEFKVARRPGAPASSGSYLSATCSLAEEPGLSCPGHGS